MSLYIYIKSYLHIYFTAFHVLFVVMIFIYYICCYVHRFDNIGIEITFIFFSENFVRCFNPINYFFLVVLRGSKFHERSGC